MDDNSILAYPGGLDTSIATCWFKEKCDLQVLDGGQATHMTRIWAMPTIPTKTRKREMQSLIQGTPVTARVTHTIRPN